MTQSGRPVRQGDGREDRKTGETVGIEDLERKIRKILGRAW